MEWHVCGISGEPDLARWEARPFSATVELGPQPGDHRDNHERVVGCETPGPPEANGIARRMADAVLRFDVYPQTLMKRYLQREPVQVGDVIGLRYSFLPGVGLFFATRVYDRFEDATDGKWRCGFSYRTLQGHPECGEETFVVEKDLASGQVAVALRAWSRPGTWLARLTAPITRRLQLSGSQAALDHLQSLVRAESPPIGRGESV